MEANQTQQIFDEERYAGFIKRIIAAFIDLLLVANVGRIVGSMIFSRESLMLALFSFTLGLVYFSYMESSKQQGTIGKIFLKIKVTDLEGERINIFKAILRYFLKFLSVVLIGIGLLMILWTDRKQGLHDLIAKTLVLNR